MHGLICTSVNLVSSYDLGSTWKQLGQDIISKSNGDQFGKSDSLYDDGITLIVGVNFNNENGEKSGHVIAYLMYDPGSNWDQIGDKRS
jgi:hypothetical protein